MWTEPSLVPVRAPSVTLRARCHPAPRGRESESGTRIPVGSEKQFPIPYVWSAPPVCFFTAIRHIGRVFSSLSKKPSPRAKRGIGPPFSRCLSGAMQADGYFHSRSSPRRRPVIVGRLVLSAERLYNISCRHPVFPHSPLPFVLPSLPGLWKRQGDDGYAPGTF